jgi:glycosyltransferase involved in cell wall biosynthesis
MSAPTLSVIIATHNDHVELANTVASIRATSDADRVEVVVVDDSSSIPVAPIERAKLRRNSRRIGCGPSRFVGATMADGEYFLICDSHMRFGDNWYQNAMPLLQPKTLHCGTCVALGKEMNPNVGSPYHGATWNFCGPFRSGKLKDDPRYNQVFECVWGEKPTTDESPIPAVMGASYFIHREWFFELDPLRHLRMWGGDEQELSLKAWLAGGEIRLLNTVRIGHLFREGKVSSSYVMPWHVLYNKLFIAHTCLPPELAMRIHAKFQRELQFSMALSAIRNDWHLLETARSYNLKIFEQSFEWYLEAFGLTFPR